MSESTTTTRKPRLTKAEREAARESKAIETAYERFEALVSAHTRVRVHFEDRKMAVPGHIKLHSNRAPYLVTNWGLELDLIHEPVTLIETKDLDSGKFVPLA